MNLPHLDTIVKEKTGIEVASYVPLSGGSISSAYKAVLSDSTALFVKTNPQFSDMFLKEVNGLRELEKSGSLKTPAILYADSELLLLEFLQAAQITNRKIFFEHFGRAFASLHRTTSDMFGFYEDNYIGSTPQKNTNRTTSWKEFYFSERLHFQFLLAEQNGYADKRLRSVFHQLEQQIENLIPEHHESPSLLHGDLWSGNFLSMEQNNAAIFDPAVYYGNREADLAMTLLFGGFDSVFYDAYNEEFPLQQGWKQRMDLYMLYHLLNHLNLFGKGYYRQVLETMQGLL
ncbi:MAG: fructosamine kinase family protein [Bacteroidetes bacterium]|nr:fructosamine kinase family protein [Bacteroidota bacterium]